LPFVFVMKQLERLERVVSVYREIYDTPREFFDIMDWQKRKLEETKARYSDYIDPFTLKVKLARHQASPRIEGLPGPTL